MAREVTLKCDFCGNSVEQIAGKLYLSPVLPGKASTSFMSGYSHWADICADCMATSFVPKMRKRQTRANGGQKTKKKKQGKVKT